MTITPYHIAIMRALALYYVLLRCQIQDLCCPRDTSGRVTRHRLLQLHQAGLVNKTRMEVVGHGEAPAPAYYSSHKGLELLACELNDEWFLTRNTLCPNW